MRLDEVGDPTERDRGAAFAPVRIGPGRRSVERTLVVVAGVLALLGLAVAKPWAGPVDVNETGARSSAPSLEAAAAGREPEAPTRPAAPTGGDGGPSPDVDLETLARWWTVLGTDYGIVSGRLLDDPGPGADVGPGTAVATVTVWRLRPTAEPLPPEALEPDCSPAAVVPVGTRVIGVTVPVEASIERLSVLRRFADDRSVVVPLRRPTVRAGVSLLVPRSRIWQPGLYAVRLEARDGVRWLAFCVASRAAGPGGPILDPAAWSLEAYLDASGRGGGRDSAGVEPTAGLGPTRPAVGRLAPTARRVM